MQAIKKIKKLRSLAENNSNEHEADRAREMSDKLMDEYNIRDHELVNDSLSIDFQEFLANLDFQPNIKDQQ